MVNARLGKSLRFFKWSVLVVITIMMLMVIMIMLLMMINNDQ